MPLGLPKRTAADAETASAPGFSVECECGTLHEGQRRRRHQQIICNQCATPLFVLPVDVYPAPAVRKKGGGDPSERPRGRTKRLLRAPVRAAKAGAGGVGRTAAGLGGRLAAAAKWFLAPLRLAVFGVLLTAVFAGYVVHRQRAVAEAEVVARESTAEGFRLLREGDYKAAAANLNAAVDAIDLIGRPAPGERRTRQAAREASALADPASGSLLDLIESVAAAGTDESGHWQRPQQFGYVRSWIVMDAALTRTEKDGRTKTRIALPVRVGEAGKPVRVVADLDVLKDVSLGETPTEVTLAAQVAAVREFPQGWEIELNPRTAFLWETPSLYLEAGFTLDPFANPRQMLEARLARQKEWQGGTPAERPVDAPPEEDAEVISDVEPEEGA